MFRVKICGVTSVEDALTVVAAGADALGLNFCPTSSRCISAELAHEIVRAVEGRLVTVGVFVDEEVEEVNRIADLVQLDRVQLHGDESPRLCAAIERPTSKALPFTERGCEPLVAFWQECQRENYPVDGLLIDGSVAGRFGGTGLPIDWPRLQADRLALNGIPWMLAGGLNPDNVSTAIRQTRPYGVDVASGVERSPGVKDPAKVAAFVAAAQAELAL